MAMENAKETFDTIERMAEHLNIPGFDPWREIDKIIREDYNAEPTKFLRLKVIENFGRESDLVL